MEYAVMRANDALSLILNTYMFMRMVVVKGNLGLRQRWRHHFISDSCAHVELLDVLDHDLVVDVVVI